MKNLLSKRTKILFTLSFLLNILLIGFVIGQLSSSYKPKPDYLNSISPASQEIIKKTMQKSHDDIRHQKQAMRQFQKQLQVIISQEEFDVEKFKEVITKLNDQKFKMSQHRSDKMIEMLKQLPASDRKAIFKKMMQHGSKKRSAPKRNKN